MAGGKTVSENYAFAGMHHIFDQHSASGTVYALHSRELGRAEMAPLKQELLLVTKSRYQSIKATDKIMILMYMYIMLNRDVFLAAYLLAAIVWVTYDVLPDTYL